MTFQRISLFVDLPLNILKSIRILGVDTFCDVQFRSHLDGKIKLMSKKYCVLNRVKRYYTSEQRLLLYTSQVCPMEYCRHIWAGRPGCQLGPFDAVQERTKRIDDPKLTDDIEPLCSRRHFVSPCLFYCLCNG